MHWRYTLDDGTERHGRSQLRPLSEAKLWLPGDPLNVFVVPDRPDHCMWEAEVGPREREYQARRRR